MCRSGLCHKPARECGYNAAVLCSARAAAYAALVHTRKCCRACTALSNPAACGGGIHDSDHIGPWSRWQGSLSADLLIVGQDWGDARSFIDDRGHDSPQGRTNTTLVKLLDGVGVQIVLPAPDDDGGRTAFFTNAILCLKDGGLQAKVRPEWFANCGSRFLRPTIDLIAPKVVVTLGLWAYRGMRAVYSLPRVAFRKAVERPDGFRLMDGTVYFPMYHCGARILNTHRPMDMQRRDWERVKTALRPEAAVMARL